MIKVLVTGANGQLGKCLQKQEKDFPGLNLQFFTSKELDITSKNEVEKVLNDGDLNYVINCAAYTNVENAEEESEKAFLINGTKVANLAGLCAKNNLKLIHISTDYVFDGEKREPYHETDDTNPLNVYGKSKLQGENEIKKNMSDFIILRTSWLYSEFGHNFFKTIQKKVADGAELNITTSQTGTPTNANDLASAILLIIAEDKFVPGVYHYSNQGEASWYDFAKAILEFSDFSNIELNKSGFYKTKAQRPVYSVLSKQKFKDQFNISIPEWKSSLKNLIQQN